MRDPRSAFGLRQFEKSELDVPLHRKPGEYAALLEDEDAARIGSSDRFAVDADFAAGGGEEAADGAQQRRFTASRGADDAKEFALGHVEIDVV